MIKVAFITSHLAPQGPNRQLLYLCKYLNRAVIDPIIVTTTPFDHSNSLISEFRHANTNVITLNHHRIQSILLGRRLLRPVLDRINPDIVHSFGFRSDLICCKIRSAKRVTSVRNTLLLNYKMIYGLFWGSIYGQINLHCIRNFDHVVSCSSSVWTHLNELKVKSTTITNCIDPNTISSPTSRRDKMQLRARLAIPTNRPVFLTVSSVLKGKNVEFLLKSFITPILSNNILIIAGPVSTEVNKQSTEHPNIITLGPVSNLQDYLTASDFFISASMHEGMPNAVLEAMGCGLPLVLSDIGPHQEIMQISRTPVGLLFKNNDYDDLCNKIAALQEQDVLSIAANCHDASRKHFSAQDMAENYERFYKQVVSN